MDYLIFNSDGSIKIKSLSQFIQKGDDGTKSVFIAIEGKSSEDYTLGGVALLPDGETTVNLTGVASELNVDGTTYPGFTLTLTAAVTLYEGQVKLSFTAIDNNDNVLVSSQILLRINPSTIEQGQEFELPYAEMIQLLSSLNSYQIKYARPNMRYYPTQTDAMNDLTNLAEGQVILTIVNGLPCFYKKNGIALVLVEKLNDYKEKIGFIVNPSGLTVGTTLSTTEINKLLCFVIYSGVVYRKDRVDGNYIQFVNDYQIIEGSTSQNDIFGRAEFTVNKNTGQVETFTIASKNIYTKEQIDYQFYNKDQSDLKFAIVAGNNAFSGNNTFTGINVFENDSPQTNDVIGDETEGTKLVTKNYVVIKVNALTNSIGGVSGRVTAIEGIIPDGAISGNKVLATEDFVNSSIENNAARPLSYNAAGDNFPTKADLTTASASNPPTFYYKGNLVIPTNLDYVVVERDESKPVVNYDYLYYTSTNDYVDYYVDHNGSKVLVTNDNKNNLGIVPGTTVCYIDIAPTTRYTYTGDWGSGQWKFITIVNNSPFTSAQWAAINSGATRQNVAQIGTNTNDIATLQSKMPITKDFVVPTTAWSLVDGKYVAVLDAGADFVIDDNAMHFYTPISDADQLIRDMYGINVSSNGTTQKFTFVCNLSNTAPTDAINFTIGQFGGN